MANHIIRQDGIFVSLATPGTDNRTLWGIDSKTYDQTAADQGFSMASAMQNWDIPPLADGTSGVVGMASSGFGSGSSSLTRLWAQTGVFGGGTVAGWTRLGVAPGGTWTSSSPDTKHSLSFSSYHTIAAGTSRTGYTVAGLTTGVVFTAVANLNYSNTSSGSGAYTQMANGRDPFGGAQCMIRLMGDYAGAGGPTDMTLQAFRQLDGSLTYSTNNTALLGSPTATDFSAAAGPWQYTLDCGAGYGRPGIALQNPASPSGAGAMRLMINGIRVCRDNGSQVPIAGTSFACIGYTGFNMEQHAGCLGVSGYTELYSAANASTVIQHMSGRGTVGSKYANRIILYTGHNPSAAEQTDLQTLQAGGAGTHVARDNIINVINQHKANAAALSDPVPQFLVVFAEWHSHNYGASNDDAGFDIAWRNECILACNATGAEFIDLFGETWNGTTRDYSLDDSGGALSLAESQARWPYMKGAATFSQAGSGSGPVVLASPDLVHNSLIGANWLWRKVWDIGMVGIGRVPGVTIASPRARITYPRGRPTGSVR